MSTIHRVLYYKLGANTACNFQFTQCEQWSRTYTMYSQLCIFRLQYSTERIRAAIGDMSTNQWALYCKHCAKYVAHPPDYATWTMVPAIYNVFTVPHIQDSIFNKTYLRCYSRYLYNSILLILQTWCQIQRTSSGLRYVNCGLGQIQRNYSCAHSDLNIQLNVPALLLETSRQVNARYNANLVQYTAHNFQFALSELWSRTYTMYLQLQIFRVQYSTKRICAAMGDISTIQCALYCKLCAKYCAHPPVYIIWTVVPGIYNLVTAPHIQYSIFSWTYLRCYWIYVDNSMCIILQTLSRTQRTSSSLRCVNCGLGYLQSIYSSAYLGFNIQL
jgi:hypothetical protein